MRTNERAVRLHDRLTHVGWIAGPEAHSLAYWTMRLADEIEGVDRYAVAYRALRELAWDNVRPFSNSQNAVSTRYPYEMQEFLRRHGDRFPAKYRQTLDEIRRALRSMTDIAFVTGRIDQHEQALAA